MDQFENFSLDELSTILERIGCRLHAKNRIAAGESETLWFLAETIRKAGQVAKLASDADHCDDILHGFEQSICEAVDQDVMRFLTLLATQPTR